MPRTITFCLEQLEDRLFLSGSSGVVEIENLSFHSLCEEFDSVQHAFHAVGKSGAAYERSNPNGQTVELVSLRPGYPDVGTTYESPVWTNCDGAGGATGENESIFKVENADASYLAHAWVEPDFVRKPMRVIVRGAVDENGAPIRVDEVANRVDLHVKVSDGHFPVYGTVYSNGSTRWKFADAAGETTKATGSFLFGPLKPPMGGETLPHADVVRMTIDLTAGAMPRIFVNYRGGGTATIDVLEASTEATRVNFTAGFDANPGTPFGQFISMITSTEDSQNSHRSEVQLIATNSHDGSYKLSHVLDQPSDFISEAYEFRNQRPGRDTNTGPEFIFRFHEGVSRFLGNKVVELGGNTPRENASGEKAKQLGTANINFHVPNAGYYLTGPISYVRESIDSTTITTKLDNVPLSSFTTVNTGAGLAPGQGWDNWATSNISGSTWLSSLAHNLQVTSSGLAEVDTAAFIRLGLPTVLPSSFRLDGRMLRVIGTNGADVFRQDFEQGLAKIRANSQEIFVDPTLFSSIRFEGKGGNDSIVTFGNRFSETANLFDGRGDITRADGSMILMTNIEKTDLNAGTGESIVHFHDSRGNDRFYGRSTYSYLTGTGFSNRVNGYDEVYAYASGGTDLAYLYDSSGNDSFYGRKANSYLTGPGYYNYAQGFDKVYAYASTGAADRAYLYDTSGNDTFYGRRANSYLTGPGYYNYAQGFDKVSAYATTGTNDRAFLYDSSVNDTFYGRKANSYLTGPGYYNYAQGFDKVSAYATTGANDRAYLYDSSGDDMFYGRKANSYLTGPGFYNYAQGFDKVSAYATTGANDLAYLYDSSGNDTFTGRKTYSTLVGSGFSNYANGFDKVYAYATAGGTADRANLYDSSGNDTFYGRQANSYMTGAGYYNHAAGFDKVSAYATAGGSNDRAYLYDTSGNDTFYGRPASSYLTGAGYYNYAAGFDNVYVYASRDAGGVGDRAYVYDSSGNDLFYGRGNYGRLTGNGFLIFAQRFDRINAYATAGGTDTINNRSLTYDFFKYGTWESIL